MPEILIRLIPLFLECDYAFNQLVASVTHGRNILDKVFVNQTDLFVSSVFDSLIKTKHKAVLIHSDNCQFKRLTSEMSRRKTRVYDLKPHIIDALRERPSQIMIRVTC